MRREGYELQIGQPQVIIKEIDGKKCEPIEELTIDLPENLSGRAVEFVTMRKVKCSVYETKGERMIVKFNIHHVELWFKKSIAYCNWVRLLWHTVL
jgi:GTP-binding protein